MLVVFGLGVLLAFVSGDARFLLLKNSFVTGAVGLVFLATVLWGTPLSVAASQSFQPARRDEIRRDYDDDPDARHGHRVSSTVWGVVKRATARAAAGSARPGSAQPDAAQPGAARPGSAQPE